MKMKLRNLSTDHGHEWYVVRCVAIDLPAIFDEMWFLTTAPMVLTPCDLRRLFRVKQLPVYLREALLSRVNPFL